MKTWFRLYSQRLEIHNLQAFLFMPDLFLYHSLNRVI